MIPHAFIAGTGSYLPQKVLSNDELAKTIETSHDWIYTRTGIASRHIADPEHESTGHMAAYAARSACDAAGITPESLDLIIVATCTPEFFFPSTACFVKHQLHITKNIPAFDITAACSGFLYALEIAQQYIMTQKYEHVLVIGSERMSRSVNWHDRATCILFGDGAGACVLRAGEKPGIISSVMHADYDQEGFLSYPNLSTPAAYIHMQGSDVFKLAVTLMGDVVDEIFIKSGLSRSSLQWLIPHQANIRIIQAIAKRLHLPMSQVIVTLENQGNTSAASIPIALDHAVREGYVHRDDLILFESFGGGMTWGATLVRY